MVDTMKAVVNYGRLNPVTLGHRKLALKMREIADQNNAVPMLFLSPSYDGVLNSIKKPSTKTKKLRLSRNPLQFEHKLQHATDALGDIVRIRSEKCSRMFDIMSILQKEGFTEITLVGDVDFIAVDFEKYNHKLYNFDKIVKVCSGERNNDSQDSLERLSATKVREAVIKNDYAAFVGMAGTRETTNLMWSRLRKEMEGAIS